MRCGNDLLGEAIATNPAGVILMPQAGHRPGSGQFRQVKSPRGRAVTLQ